MIFRDIFKDALLERSLSMKITESRLRRIVRNVIKETSSIEEAPVVFGSKHKLANFAQVKAALSNVCESADDYDVKMLCRVLTDLVAILEKS